jgi:hypothetical protein
MRYVSEQARALAHYRTLPQWLKIVRAMSHCSSRDAKQQILDGLKDRKFGCRWKETHADRAGDHPPWRDATVTSEWINWRNGKIYCDQRLTDEALAAGWARWLTPLLTPIMATVFWEMLAKFQAEPAQVAPFESAPSTARSEGIRKVKSELGIPGKDIPWKTFNDRVREFYHVTAQTRGFGDRSIERSVQSIRSRRTK